MAFAYRLGPAPAALRLLCLVVAALGALAEPVLARSWSDLDEGEVEIYGREREEKLPLRLFFVQREKWEKHDALHILWLYGYKDYPRYRSNRLLPFWYRLESKVDNRTLFLSPVYYREADAADYDQSVLWLYYWGNNQLSGTRYSTLLPFWYETSTPHRNRKIISPLFWYSRSLDEGQKAEGSYSLGFPLIPLVMWNSGPAERDLVLFHLLRYRSYDSALTHYALPLYYYHSTPNSGTLLTPLFYHHSAPELRRFWLFPLLYYNRYQNYSSFLLLPVWYSEEYEGGHLTVSPLYIRNRSNDSELDAFIPFYLSYSKKDFQLHVNAAGISLTEEKFSALPFGGGISGNRVYADWDFGWFYSLIHISNRSSIALTAGPAAAETPALVKTAISGKRSRSRADSESFFGFYALFGALAWEKADHYRHFRLLPLSWLTWDSRTDTGVQTVIPFYVHYRDNESRYLVIAPLLVPFYAAQEKTESFRQQADGVLPELTARCRSSASAWLMIAYIDEFDCEKRQVEQTLLWPVFNRYASAERGGYRIFPLYWNKWRQTPAGKEFWNFSPLHYMRTRQDEFYLITLPFYYNRKAAATHYGTWGLFHIGREPKESITYFFPVFFRSEEIGGTNETGNDARRETLLTVAGLWWRYAESREGAITFSAQLSPLYLHFADNGRTYFYSWLWYSNTTAGGHKQGIPLLYHQNSRDDGSYRNFYLFPFYYSAERLQFKETSDTETVSWLVPLWYSRSDSRQSARFIAGYWYERSPDYAADNFLLLAGRTDEHTAQLSTWHALLYTVYAKSAPKRSEFSLVYGLLFDKTRSEYSFSWHFALVTGYKYLNDGSYRRHHLLPLWWYSVHSGDTALYLPFALSMFTQSNDGNRRFQAVALGLFWYENSDDAAYTRTAAIGAGTIWYHNRTAERRFDSYGSLFGLLWHYETEENYRRLSLLTFIYIRTETEQGVRHRLLGIPLN